MSGTLYPPVTQAELRQVGEKMTETEILLKSLILSHQESVRVARRQQAVADDEIVHMLKELLRQWTMIRVGLGIKDELQQGRPR